MCVWGEGVVVVDVLRECSATLSPRYAWKKHWYFPAVALIETTGTYFFFDYTLLKFHFYCENVHGTTLWYSISILIY